MNTTQTPRDNSDHGRWSRQLGRRWWSLSSHVAAVTPTLGALHVSCLLLAVVASTQPSVAAEEEPSQLKNADGSWKYTNDLVHETSPYLLQHAHNPVDWMPWGEQAFLKAQREQKPIFLSVGYSACYWCAVMEREVFADPEIARELNRNYVCIKVDREERPDIDQIYMIATQIMTGAGGWPMNVFLTPPASLAENANEAEPPAPNPNGKTGYGLKPFFCTTYMPPTTKDGKPGFDKVTATLHKLWTDDRDRVLLQAQQLSGAVHAAVADSSKPGPVTAATAYRATDDILETYDEVRGGFKSSTGGPKFPNAGKLMLLLELAGHESESGIRRYGHAQSMALQSLDRMARGGIYDQLGGGFHRYATDERWLIPHFEKMLYDNGRLLSVYAAALRQLREQGKSDSAAAVQFESVLRETSDYLLREMRDSTGAFWSAQGAQVDGLEGASYLWTRTEVESAIDDAELRSLAVTMYGLEAGPNFQDPHSPDAEPRSVLYLPVSLAELSQSLGMSDANLRAQQEAINQQLKRVRDKRKQPTIDDKVLVSWNGLAIKGLAESGAVLGEPQYTEAAGQAADAILTHMSTDDGGLYRTMREGQVKTPALLEDYTHFSAGLLALARAGHSSQQRVEQAARLTAYAMEHFAAEPGGYFDTLPDQSEYFVRSRVAFDDAVPSGNSVMVQNLLEQYRLTNDAKWFDQAVRDLRSFSKDLDDHGAAMEVMLAALLDATRLEDANVRLEAPAD